MKPSTTQEMVAVLREISEFFLDVGGEQDAARAEVLREVIDLIAPPPVSEVGGKWYAEEFRCGCGCNSIEVRVMSSVLSKFGVPTYVAGIASLGTLAESREAAQQIVAGREALESMQRLLGYMAVRGIDSLYQDDALGAEIATSRAILRRAEGRSA